MTLRDRLCGEVGRIASGFDRSHAILPSVDRLLSHLNWHGAGDSRDQQPAKAFLCLHSLYICESIMLLILDSSLLSQRFTIAKLHNRPFPTPSPLPAPAIAAPTFCLPELLILPFRQPNNNISLACSQRERADT